mmetsp:Transcript_25387/g.48019  ORF Transcript_25387/g.48019 Transcript_25387/m.48019 type:complete len:206 (-) Transcript_25387:4072-4689(-)
MIVVSFRWKLLPEYAFSNSCCNCLACSDVNSTFFAFTSSFFATAFGASLTSSKSVPKKSTLRLSPTFSLSWNDVKPPPAFRTKRPLFFTSGLPVLTASASFRSLILAFPGTVILMTTPLTACLMLTSTSASDSSTESSTLTAAAVGDVGADVGASSASSSGAGAASSAFAPKSKLSSSSSSSLASSSGRSFRLGSQPGGVGNPKT